jgi:hypothetical protein
MDGLGCCAVLVLAVFVVLMFLAGDIEEQDGDDDAGA